MLLLLFFAPLQPYNRVCLETQNIFCEPSFMSDNEQQLDHPPTLRLGYLGRWHCTGRRGRQRFRPLRRGVKDKVAGQQRMVHVMVMVVVMVVKLLLELIHVVVVAVARLRRDGEVHPVGVLQRWARYRVVTIGEDFCGRHRLLPLYVVDSLSFDFQVAQHRHQNDEHDDTQAAADDQAKPSFQERLNQTTAGQTVHFGQIVGRVLECSNAGAPADCGVSHVCDQCVVGLLITIDIVVTYTVAATIYKVTTNTTTAAAIDT